MVIKYVISPYPTLAEDLVVKIYEAENPTAEVYSETIPQPHNDPVNIVVNGLDRVVHVIKLYAATSATLLHKYNHEPKEDVVTIFDPIRFKIGDGGTNTPAANTNAYINTDFAGLTGEDYDVFRNGYGVLFEGVHRENRTGGGFNLFQDGDVFNGDNGGEEFLILRKPKTVTSPVNDSVVGKLFGGFLNVTTSVDYAASHLRKLIRLIGENAEYNFPVAASIPVGYVFRVTNFGAYGATTPLPKVNFDNAALQWGNTTITTIDVPLYGTYEFVFDGTNWNCSLFQTVPYNPAYYISYIGSQVLGDVPHSDGYWTITIPNQGGTTYKVLGTLVGQGVNPDYDDDNFFIVYEKTNTQFKVAVREVSPNVQNLLFEFAIAKAS